MDLHALQWGPALEQIVSATELTPWIISFGHPSNMMQIASWEAAGCVVLSIHLHVHLLF
jgi:hypothetical protein